MEVGLLILRPIDGDGASAVHRHFVAGYREVHRPVRLGVRTETIQGVGVDVFDQDELQVQRVLPFGLEYIDARRICGE